MSPVDDTKRTERGKGGRGFFDAVSGCAGGSLRFDCHSGSGRLTSKTAPESSELSLVEKPDLAAMRPHDIGGDCQAKTGSAGAHGAAERLEQPLARRRRQSGAVICDMD